MADSTAWLPDAVLPGFETLTIPFPADYDGPVVVTLVRRLATAPTRRAVLYIHGFIDYFFQAHLAEAYNAQGWNFYALDLRKHGRSIRPGQHANFAKDMREYFADITAAIVLIKGQESNTTLLLNGHSTGRLIAALYADSGRLRDQIDALFLNSPFLGWNVSALEAFGLKLFGAIGKRLPFIPLRGAFTPFYAQSVHTDHHGEWTFDTTWKPIEGFPVYFGWIGAISRAQQEAQHGLSIRVPVLLMHAARSYRGKVWHDDILASDGVLNVEDMKRYGPGLGSNVTLIEIADGIHDLTLSRRDVREHVAAELHAWLARTLPAPAEQLAHS